MGAAIGAVLRQRAIEVLWASDGRSEQTAARAKAAGLADVKSIGALAQRADVILSVCPPHAARDVASAVGEFPGVYVDANAVAPCDRPRDRRRIRALRRRRHRRAAARRLADAPLSLRQRRAASRRPLRRHEASTRASSRTRSEPHPPSRRPTPPGRRAAPRCCSRSARWHAPKASRTPCWRSGASRSPASKSDWRGPSARRRQRAGAGSARWRRSPRRSRPPARPDGFHRAAAEVYRRYERMF